MKNSIIIIFVTALLVCPAAQAQDFIRHEFSANMGGGMSGFQSKASTGKSVWKGTCTGGLGYRYFFHPQWSVGTGINFTACNGGITIDNYHTQQATTNKFTGHAFDFITNAPHYEETQQLMMITVPLMAQYRHRMTKEMDFYAALGGKLGFPVSAKVQQNGRFTTSGYYPAIGVTYENLPEYGFVNDQPFPEDNIDSKVKTAFMAAVELGVKWELDKTMGLYAGIYADCGLNNVLGRKNAGDSSHLVVYQSDTPAQPAYNTAATRIVPFAAGLTLRFVFHRM